MSTSNVARDLNIQSLPDTSVTRSGYLFNPNDDKWVIPHASGTRYFYFQRIAEVCDQAILWALKSTLCWYLRHKSVPHSSNMLTRFEHFLLNASHEEQWFEISDIDIRNYFADLDKEHEWYLGSLRGFLKKWSDLGYPGIANEAIRLLDRMTIKGNRKGWAVLTMDPDEGPYTNRELTAIHMAVNAAYASGELSNRQMALAWMFMAFGARPSQVASLKTGDFQIAIGADDIAEYLIEMPRAKQRNQPSRTEFKTRKMIEAVGRVMQGWCNQVKSDGLKMLGDEPDLNDLPLFPSWRRKCNDEEFKYHSSGELLRNELAKIVGRLNVISHRTQEPIRITPTRFRYTLGTRAAIEKAGAAVIAELLDHSDMQNVMVYVKHSPEILEELDAELADDLEPLAQAFRGEVVLFEQDDSSRPCRVIRYPGVDPEKSHAGSCQRETGCRARIPEACYVCENFHAYSDGPHQEMLEYLEAEKARELAVGGDATVARATDHVIEAVKIVIRKCYELKGGM